MKTKSRTLLILALAYGVWHTCSQWTNTLLSFLHWDTYPPMSILDVSYTQAFGSFCNALGAFTLGQMIDSSGPRAVFIAAAAFTSLYYIGISFAKSTFMFFLVQFFRVGYHFDAATEMYLATLTTERERTSAMVSLGLPQGMALLLGPLLAAKAAMWFSLRTSELICGLVTSAALIPLIIWFLPETHSVPKLASARLRPQDYIPLLSRSALREAIILRVLLVAPYICYELIGRQFLLRMYFSGPHDTAMMLLVMGVAIILVQFAILPKLQRAFNPKRILQIALAMLLLSYVAIIYSRSYKQVLFINALQAASYALAYAETSTQITSSVELGELGKATGLASAAQWIAYCLMPLYTGHLVASWHYIYAFYTSATLTILTMLLVTFGCKHLDARVQNILPIMGF